MGQRQVCFANLPYALCSLPSDTSLMIAFFSMSADGTFLSLPDSTLYVLHRMPGEPPSSMSLPFIRMVGEPLSPSRIASS